MSAPSTASSSSSPSSSGHTSVCSIADGKGVPVEVQGSTVLITGGSSGLGLALAKRFLANGATVIITGRRQALLDDAKKQFPALHTLVSDAGSASGRELLFRTVIDRFPQLNIVINNAGIQRREPLATDAASWSEKAEEIEINLNAPIHFCTLFAPFLQSLKKPSVLANVSSGLAFVPFVGGPIYSATKAGVHSFTVALRWSLASTQVQVIEIIPPSVYSNLGGGHAFGENQDDWADSTYSSFVAGNYEVGFKVSESLKRQSRSDLDTTFANMSNYFVKTFGYKQY